jgi:hypothetical protein
VLWVIQVEQIVFSDMRSMGRGQAEGSHRLLCDPAKIFDIENEGESHDIVENKGRNFLTHDVYDK